MTRRECGTLITAFMICTSISVAQDLRSPAQVAGNWVSGNHVEFSTDTRQVLTFRGQVNEQGMSGLYGIQGRHAPWKAERTD